MKTKIYFFVIIMLCSIAQALAQYPIPSYGVSVTQQANFEEQGNFFIVNQIPLAKREVNIQVRCPTISTHSPCAEIWVYSLDRQTILGPYYGNNDDILIVSIDYRLWGVYIIATYELNASVWISDTQTLKSTKLFEKNCVNSLYYCTHYSQLVTEVVGIDHKF